MNILETSREFAPEDLYKLTKDPLVEKLKDHADEQLEVTGYCLYEDTDTKTGELRPLLALELAEGPAVATNSPTVMRSWKDICDIYAATSTAIPYPLMIAVFTKTANSSKRDYLNIRLVQPSELAH